jgi:DNA-directed RNA polymerase subunit RPC12/RpoP
MTIRCSACGCAKFFFTLPKREKSVKACHHGAYCARCGKPLNLRDLSRPVVTPSLPVTFHTE